MSEKVVVIYVSREFRDKIKAKKRELTYEQFLNNLLKKLPEKHSISQAHAKKNHSQQKEEI